MVTLKFEHKNFMLFQVFVKIPVIYLLLHEKHSYLHTKSQVSLHQVLSHSYVDQDPTSSALVELQAHVQR